MKRYCYNQERNKKKGENKKMKSKKLLSLVVVVAMLVSVAGVIGASANVVIDSAAGLTVDTTATNEYFEITVPGATAQTTIMMFNINAMAAQITAETFGVGDETPWVAQPIAYVNQIPATDAIAGHELLTAAAGWTNVFNEYFLIRVGGTGTPLQAIVYTGLYVENDEVEVEGVLAETFGPGAALAPHVEGVVGTLTFNPVLVSGALPTGVTLNTDGTFAGEPVVDFEVAHYGETYVEFEFEVSATDARGRAITFSVVLTVYAESQGANWDARSRFMPVPAAGAFGITNARRLFLVPEGVAMGAAAPTDMIPELLVDGGIFWSIERGGWDVVIVTTETGTTHADLESIANNDALIIWHDAASATTAGVTQTVLGRYGNANVTAVGTLPVAAVNRARQIGVGAFPALVEGSVNRFNLESRMASDINATSLPTLAVAAVNTIRQMGVGAPIIPAIVTNFSD